MYSAKRIGRYLRWTGLAAVCAVVVVMAAVWVEHLLPVEIPPPTGPHAVGRVVLDWREPMTSGNSPEAQGREVLAWIWYPAIQPRDGMTGPFLPPGTVAQLRSARGVVMSGL